MTINLQGLSLIRKFEGCVLTAYKDVVGVWTIGFGHTGPDVTPGLVWTQTEAEFTLEEDLKRFEAGVTDLLKVAVTSNQFSALVSFAYNLGLEALKGSNLLHKINDKLPDPEDEFLKWCYAGGKENFGILRRRMAERNLFTTPDSH